MKDIERGLILVLVVLLISSISGLGYLYYDIKKANDELTLNYEKTLVEIEKLNANLSIKEDKIKELQGVIDIQTDEIAEKTEEIDRISATVIEYESKLTEMISYNDTVSQELIDERTNKIPDNYYSERYTNYTNNVNGLSEFLTYGFELPVSYSLNVFDCSESSAYLEWCLEKEGFDAEICIGPAPFDPSGYHAWIIVNTSDGYIVAVEPTALTGGAQKWIDRFSSLFDKKARGVVYYDENDPTSVKYYDEYDDSFDSIYEAVDATNLEEWNWWEGAWGLN